MRNIRLLCKLENMLLFMFLLALAGCGANTNVADNPSSSGMGKIAAKIAFSADGKTAAKTLAAVPAEVLSVRFKVTGPYQIPGNTSSASRYTTTKASFPAADGGGTVAVAAGTGVTVNAEALGAGDVILYEGFKSGVTITAGQTTDIGTISMLAPMYKQADVPCLGCHENTRSVTGDSLVAEYKQTAHYRRTVSPSPRWGVNSTGCAGCHGPEHNVLDPATDGRCIECHTSANFVGSNTTLRDNHYRTIDATATPSGARYLNAAANNCSSCHQPHNLSAGSKQRVDWAASGHGNTASAPWAEETWGSPCIACHTAGGFVKALGNNWTDTTVSADTQSGMPLNCNACHSSNDFKNSVRKITTGYVAGMGGFGSSAKATIAYPNVNDSNICIPCHASRENGKSIILGVSNFANQSFKNPHYLGAAAVFYGQGGFQFYSSASQTQYYAQAYTTKYGVVADGTIIPAAAASTSNSTPAIAVGDSLVGNKAPWSHGKLGMSFVTAVPTTGANVGTIKDNAGNILDSGNKGQCIACHLGPESAHSFDAFDGAKATWKAGRTLGGCYGCHVGEDMKEVAETEERPKFDAAMEFFQWQLVQTGAYYSDAYPYFYTDSTATTQLKNWTALTVPGGTGAANMGAAMNFKLLAAEKGAHVHNRTFMKQMIFDSVQYLQKGSVSFSHRNLSSGSTDPNGLVSFADYSTAVGGLKAQTARTYIVRKTTSGATGGTAAVPVWVRN